MSRPPAAGPKEKVRPYIVSAGCIIGGYDGKRREGGDSILLTTKQATYFNNLGMVFRPIVDEEDEPDDTEADTRKAEQVTKTHGVGDGDSDTAPADQPAPKAGKLR